ncbi:MAG: hypothetical protein [Bacteriophage sp.]|nr:MAG: hypothetical protein [Bacteriophage sp.]
MIAALRLFLSTHWRLVLLAVVVLLALGGSFWAGHEWSDRAWSERWAQRDANDSSQEANAQAAARIIEQGRNIAREESVKYANEQAAKARAAAAASGAALDRLLERASKEAARREAADQTAALGRASGEQTARMYSDLLRRTGEAARRYADIAEGAITAGEVCERNYDAVERQQ